MLMCGKSFYAVGERVLTHFLADRVAYMALSHIFTTGRAPICAFHNGFFHWGGCIVFFQVLLEWHQTKELNFSNGGAPWKAHYHIFSTERVPLRTLYHVFSSLSGQPRRHITVLSLMKGHPKRHFLSHFLLFSHL